MNAIGLKTSNPGAVALFQVVVADMSLWMVLELEVTSVASFGLVTEYLFALGLACNLPHTLCRGVIVCLLSFNAV